MLPPIRDEERFALMKTKSKNNVGAEDLMEDLRTLASDAKLIFESSVQEPTAEALESLRERVDQAKARLAEYYDVAKEKTVAGAKATDTAIREKPYHAIAIAAGVGLLVGLYLSRDKD